MNALHILPGLSKVQLKVAVFEEGRQVKAYAPALDLAAYGTDVQTAVDALMKTIRITLAWAKQKNTLYELLLENGWTLKEKPTPEYKPPVFNINQLKKNLHVQQFETRDVPLLMSQ